MILVASGLRPARGRFVRSQFWFVECMNKYTPILALHILWTFDSYMLIHGFSFFHFLLSRNFLHKFPSELCQMNLYSVNLSNNRLLDIPHNVGELIHIQCLVSHQCTYVQLSRSFTAVIMASSFRSFSAI